MFPKPILVRKNKTQHNKSTLSPNQKKCTTTRNKHKNPKPGLVAYYDTRPGNREGLFWFPRSINHLLTYLDTYPLTYSSETHTGCRSREFTGIRRTSHASHHHKTAVYTATMISIVLLLSFRLHHCTVICRRSLHLSHLWQITPSQILNLLCHYLLTELRFYVPLDTK